MLTDKEFANKEQDILDECSNMTLEQIRVLIDTLTIYLLTPPPF